MKVLGIDFLTVIADRHSAPYTGAIEFLKWAVAHYKVFLVADVTRPIQKLYLQKWLVKSGLTVQEAALLNMVPIVPECHVAINCDGGNLQYNFEYKGPDTYTYLRLGILAGLELLRASVNRN